MPAFCTVTSCINLLYMAHTRSSKNQRWFGLFQASTSSEYHSDAAPFRVVPQRSTLTESLVAPVILCTRYHRSIPVTQVSNISMSSSPEYFSGADTLRLFILGIIWNS